MLDLLTNLPGDALDGECHRYAAEFPGYASYYRNQPPSVQAAAPKPNQRPDVYFLNPRSLFERICAIHADSAVYARWLEYTRRRGRDKEADEVAMRWRRALPRDKAPLLHLMESAAQRNALDKALKFLQQAEELDAVDSSIQRARLRLWVAKALRHFAKGRPDLAGRDLDEMEQLPQLAEGDRRAFLAALRWVQAHASGNAQEAARWEQETIRLMGDRLPADVLRAAVGIGIGPSAAAVHSAEDPPAGDLVAAAGRACILGEDLGFPIRVPSAWVGYLGAALSVKLADRSGADPAALAALARAAIGSEDNSIAFLASGIGLRQGGALEARFLLFRGQSFPRWFGRRRDECFSAAAELARRRRDMDLLAETVDLRRHYAGWGGPFSGEAPDAAMSAEDLAHVLRREADAAKFPTDPNEGLLKPRAAAPGRGGLPWPEEGSPFPLPSPYGDEDDDFEDGDFDDEGEEDDDLGLPFAPPRGMPKEVIDVFVKLFRVCEGRMPTDRDMERIGRKHPEVAAELQRVLEKYDPSELGDKGDEGFLDLDDFFPQPSWHKSKRETREARRARRKKQRNSRRR